MITVATSAIITAALKELNAIQAGAPVPGQQMVDGLELLNNILDDYNAQRGKVYADSFLPFTITPNLNPHTIGPAGATWVMTQRPVSIEGIQVNLGGSPAAYVYVRPRDAKWWQTNPSPAVTAPFPKFFYYDPTLTTAAPRGSIYMWPVPRTAYNVQVWTRIILGQLTANQQISLPPGYNYALRMVLAKRWAPSLRKLWTPSQETLAVEAERTIESNNVVVPRVSFKAAGMPSGDASGLPNFMWPDGSLGAR